MNQTETSKRTVGEEASEEYLRRKQRTKWGCCLVAALIPFGLIALMFLGYYLWKTRSRSALLQLEEEISQRGEPLTTDEMYAAYKPPAGVTDKTELFLALMPMLTNKSFMGEQRDLPIVGEGDEFSVDRTTDWPQQQEVRDFFDRHSGLMQDIENAALAEGEVRFPLKFEDGIMLLLENSQNIRSMVRLLDLQARLQARQGKADEAHRSIMAIFGAADAVEHEPFLVSMLIRVACRAVAQNTICDLLPETDWSDEQLQQLIDECLRPDWNASVKNSMIGERAMGRIVFENPAQLGAEVASVRYITSYEDERYYIDFLTRCIDAVDEPFPEAMKKLEQIEGELQNATQFQKFSRPVSMLMLPALNSAVRAAARQQVTDRATAVHLAVELHRRKRGELPETLEELVPDFLDEIPIDPFSTNRQPLIYRVDKTEVIIYSVYENQTDDGGDETDMADWVTRVKRRPEVEIGNQPPAP